MTKRLFTLAIMSILALSAWADETSWTWNFTDNNTWTTAKIVTGSDVTLNTGATTPGTGEYGVTFNFVSDKASITSSGLGYLSDDLGNSTTVVESNYVSIEIPVGFQATFNFTSAASSGRAIYYTTDGSNTQTNSSSNIIVYRNEGENPVTLKVWAKNPVRNSASLNIISSIVLEYLSNITYHRWTVNAIIKNTDTQIDTWTKDEIAEGSEFNAYLKKVIKYNEQYYELADDTYTGLFIQDTMNEDKVYSVNYQLSDDIVFFKEGEDITQSTVSETASGGAFCGYIGRPIAASAITIPNAGYYKAEALVMETRKSPILTFWNGTDNYSNNNSAAGITIGDGVAGLNYSDKFQVNSSTTYYLGGTAKEGENVGYNNSLAFDYILIRRLSDPTVENLAAATPTYNGSAQNLVTTPTVTGGSIKYSTTQDGTYTEAIPQGTNVGDYSVWYKVTGDATHSDIAATQVPSVSITQATNTLSGTLSIDGWTYGSEANSPFGVIATFGTVAYKYSNAENGEYGSYDVIVNGAVGTWWVKAYVDGTDNYTAVESDAVSFTISEAPPTSYAITVTQPESSGTVGVKVGNAEVTTANTTATAGQNITLSNKPAENYTFTSYSVTKAESGDAVTVTDGSFTMPAEAVIVTAVFEATPHVHNFNYTVGTGDNTNILIATCQNTSCNLTDNKATLTLTAEGGTYNGSAFSATTDVDAFNVATGLSATVSINYTGDNSYNSTDAPTNAGTYIATATVTIGDTNYTLNKSFTIAKASITELTITELDAPVKGMALDTEVACSTTGIESASVVWKKGETDATGNAEASTVYTAIVTLTASSNYVFAESPTVNAISEKAGAVTRNNDTQISVAYTFDATTADDPVTHTLTVNVDDASHGSVTIIVAGEAASSGVAVAEGASVSVTATANSGYTFKNWGNTELTANPYNFTMGTSGVNLTATFEEESKVNAEQTWTFNSITTGTQYKSIVEIGNGLYIRGSNGRSLSVSESDAAETITFSDNHEEEVSKTLVAANVPNGNAPTTAGNANGILGTIALNINTAGTLYIKLKAGNFDNHTDNPRLRLQNSLGTLNQVTPTDGTTIHELKYSFENASVAYLNTAGNIFLNIYAIRFVPTPEATITADATQSKTYNGTAQALTASASAGGVTITYYTNADHSEGETTTAPTNAGTYYAIVSQSDANYTSTPVNVTFTILPKDLTITAMNQTVSIGGSITEGVGLVTTNGLVEGDELTGITLDASSTEAATESGTITPSNAVIKNSASNYNISYVTGTLTVVAGTQSYNIVVPSAVNGNSVSANPTSATEGTGITLTITTAENYTLSSINADNNVELSGSGETRTFTMPAANVTITATWTINQADTGDNATSETYTVTETGGIEVSSVTTNINSSSITIPAKVGSANVTSIANDAFDNVAKENIRSIDLSATSITGVTVNRSSGIFNGFPEETMIYMPAGNTEASGQKNVIIGGTCSDFVMTDEKSYNIPTSFTATKATLSRSFTSGVTCTICLPYDVPAGNLDGNIYQFSEVNGTTVKMTQKEGGLVANTPYIFVPSGNVTQITATSVTINMSGTPNTSPDGQSFTFKGVFEHKDFTTDEISGGIYGFAADANHGALSVGQFVKASNGAWAEGMRAYLAYSGSLSETEVASTRGEGLPDVLNVVLIHANGSTTNIGRMELMTADDGSPVYNLNGQRVDSSYKGIVIKNGKKVVKK